jgi:hypothetical protein
VVKILVDMLNPTSRVCAGWGDYNWYTQELSKVTNAAIGHNVKKVLKGRTS